MDDQPEIRKLVALTLATMPCVLASAACASEAIRWLEQHVPDVIVLDLMLPDENGGFSVLQWVRRSARHRQTRIIVASALDAQEEKLIDRGLHPDAYLVKPFSPARLKELVMRWA